MISKGNVKHMVNCRKAIHVSQFSDVLVKRKIPALNQALISGKLNEKFQEIPYLYKTKKFAEKFPAIGNSIQEVKKYLNDNNTYSNDFTSVRYSKFVAKLVDTTMSNVQEDISTTLDLITEYCESKNKYYQYLDVPSGIDVNEYDEFWNVVNILFTQK
jgi:Fe-S oxidoreductase